MPIGKPNGLRGSISSWRQTCGVFHSNIGRNGERRRVPERPKDCRGIAPELTRDLGWCHAIGPLLLNNGPIETHLSAFENSAFGPGRSNAFALPFTYPSALELGNPSHHCQHELGAGVSHVSAHQHVERRACQPIRLGHDQRVTLCDEVKMASCSRLTVLPPLSFSRMMSHPAARRASHTVGPVGASDTSIKAN